MLTHSRIHLLTRWTAAAGIVLATVGAQANLVVVNDDFEDGGFDDNPANPLDTVFDTNASGASTTFGLVDLAGDTFLELNPGTSNNKGITGGLPSPITLSNAGDFIELQITVQYTDPAGPADVRNGLSIGFRDGTDVDSSGEFGASVNPGSLSGGPNNDGVFFSDLVQNLSGRHNTTGFGMSPQTLTYRLGLSAGDASTVEYSLSGAVIDETGNLASGTDPISDFVAGSSITLQTLFIEQGGGNSSRVTFAIDDVIVTTNVPEPGSLALLGLGAGCIVARRRRAD
jgi:hypothetical protein